MFKINYGYGTAKKSYSTLKGAKIACAAWFKKSSGQWLDVVELKSIMIDDILHTDVIHHTIFRND